MYVHRWSNTKDDIDTLYLSTKRKEDTKETISSVMYKKNFNT